MSEEYNISAFIQSVKEMDRSEIIHYAGLVVGHVERESYGARGAVRRREQGSTEYAAHRKNFLYFLRYGEIPASASDYELRLYRPVAERLVEKGQFEPTVLDLFKDQ